MSATYSKTSPYYGTPLWGQYLDIWSGKTILHDVTDQPYQISTAYNLRPDLLAYDLYGDANLWWVFSIRNPDIITDPLMGFQAGLVIIVPTLATVKKSLGL
jgi:Base plate wedge protein 53